MDYQMLVLDLDGTLTNSRKEITESVLAGIISRLNLKTINIRSSKNM